MDYPFKRGFKPDIARIREILEEVFQVQIKENDGKLLFRYGTLESARIWVENKRLFVITESVTSASDNMVVDTNKRFRIFLEKATGYTAKQRLEMAKKEVQNKGNQ
jgi:hypothetical protein